MSDHPNVGGTFNEFLKEVGDYDEVSKQALIAVLRRLAFRWSEQGLADKSEAHRDCAFQLLAVLDNYEGESDD